MVTKLKIAGGPYCQRTDTEEGGEEGDSVRSQLFLISDS